MTEAKLEEKFISKLEQVGYQRVNVSNFEELEGNLRIQLNKLNDIELTDDQFEEIKRDLKKNKNIFDAATFLRSVYTLNRKGNHLKEIYFLDTVNYARNIFQVTNQFKVKGKFNNNRYDVTILVNGLPLVHIELKKSTENITSAFNQIERYKKESMAETYFDYVQLFITSNEHTTYYISNNQKLNKRFLYDWKNEVNSVIGNLFDFTDAFLESNKLAKYLSKYMILSIDEEKNEKIIMAMRSYQVGATEKVLKKVKLSDGNGYIWHTTGSGKTLTSFKTAQLVSKMSEIDKVIFIVDRVDLDDQTVEEYNKFIDKAKNNSSTSDGSIPNIKSTEHLAELLANNTDKIIVTTIQKLERLTKRGKFNKNKRVVLIFDECHRSQLGDMHKNIDRYFDYPQKFGFTGTPIMPQNRKDKSGELATTSDVFDEQLHTYLINDAISDGNVLGFQVDYKSVLNLKEESKITDQDVAGIDTKEVFESIEYIKTVACDIVNTYDRFTHNRSYNAMLATSGIKSAIKYYNLLKGREVDGVTLDLPESFRELKIACVYSVADNEEQSEEGKNNREHIIDIINDHNVDFNMNFEYNTMSAFKNNVTRLVKEKEIDLLIVSDMYLTGFDAKQLNTLYFDKKQQHHNLIQSVSRTNRVYDDKKDYGQIIFYQPSMKKAMDEALEIFSNRESDKPVLKESYEELLAKAKEYIGLLVMKYPNIDVVNNLHQGQEEKEYLLAVRNVTRIMNAIETYRDFDMGDIPISKHEIDVYTAKYKEIYRKNKTVNPKNSVLEDFDFEIQLIKSDKIDYDYIKNIISKVDDSSEPEMEVMKILSKFEMDPNLKSKYELLKLFFANYHEIESDKDIRVQFDEFTEIIVTKKIMKFSEQNELDSSQLIKLNKEYKFSNDYETGHAIENELISGKHFRVKNKLKANIKDFILNDINNTVISIDDLDEA